MRIPVSDPRQEVERVEAELRYHVSQQGSTHSLARRYSRRQARVWISSRTAPRLNSAVNPLRPVVDHLEGYFTSRSGRASRCCGVWSS